MHFTGTKYKASSFTIRKASNQFGPTETHLWVSYSTPFYVQSCNIRNATPDICLLSYLTSTSFSINDKVTIFLYIICKFLLSIHKSYRSTEGLGSPVS